MLAGHLIMKNGGHAMVVIAYDDDKFGGSFSDIK